MGINMPKEDQRFSYFFTLYTRARTRKEFQAKDVCVSSLFHISSCSIALYDVQSLKHYSSN